MKKEEIEEYFELAECGNWGTHDKEILKLKNKEGELLAHILAMRNPYWQTNDKEILKLDGVFRYPLARGFVDIRKIPK